MELNSCCPCFQKFPVEQAVVCHSIKVHAHLNIIGHTSLFSA
ncbi:hypothetical protein BN2497_2233 [Janthinobacterium sp. CG23_2]|nr:hypothetical protein BN2497_2233 [Janthinobacterium sp. CG23_2]CUU27514.1 hypothetical protein BN3177_2233 [Janthinobacterium sp. CG23_2]